MEEWKAALERITYDTSKFPEKMEADGIQTMEEYDRKHPIHYMCREWLGELADLLEKSGEQEKYHAVLKYCGES